MLKKLIGVVICLIGLQSRGYSNILIGIPHDTLYAGSKGMEWVLPVTVDSIGPEDSIVGYQIGIVTDSTRIRFLGVNTDGTLSSSCQIQHSVDSTGELKIDAILSDLSSSIVGSGALIYVLYEDINDTAGVAPVTLDTVFSLLGKATAEKEPGVRYSSGNVTFIPTMGLGIQSESDTIYADSVITIPVLLGNVRGDRIRSVYLRFKSNDQHLLIAGADSSGTLMGELGNEGTYIAVPNADGRLSVNASRNSIKDGEIDSLTAIKIKLLIHSNVSFTGTVTIDSMAINGFAEPFEVFKDTVGGLETPYVIGDTGTYNITVIATGVDEKSVTGAMDFQLYPNPVNDFFTVNSLNNTAGYELGLYDEQGKAIRLYKMTGSSMNIDLSRYDLPSGMYTVRIYGDNKIFNKRILFLH